MCGLMRWLLFWKGEALASTLDPCSNGAETSPLFSIPFLQ